MRWAKAVVAVLSALLFASLFLPCVRVSYPLSAPVPPVEVTVLVGNTLLGGLWLPHAVYLLSVPVASALASVLLFGLRLSPRGAMWAGLGGAAYVVLPNVSVPQVKIGAVSAWHWTLRPVLTPTEVLYGFHVHTSLLGALAAAYLALGLAALAARRRAARRAD